jgi:hypothetical protein
MSRRCLTLALLCLACSDDDGPGVEPVPLTPGAYTYALTESTAALSLWTLPPTAKPREQDRAPTTTASGLKLSAAGNEFEPTLLVIGPASGSVRVAVAPFASLGAAGRVEVARVEYEEGWGEGLVPISADTDVALDGARPTALWITVYVPPGAPAGDAATTLTLTPSGGAPIQIPIALHVFAFDLPAAIGFHSQLNMSIAEVGQDALFAHRLTPASVTWPSGFGWWITWDNTSSPTRCTAFYDESDQAAEYAIGALARRYLLGEGWNGVGFDQAEIFQFVDNATPRPGTFCDIPRGDHAGSAAYNAAWSEWLAALDAYLVDAGLDARTYYYVQNEPQDEADYALAAHLCRLTRAAAPHLRIAVSEEPKPEIAEEAGGACGWDIWIAHVRAYQRAYAQQRMRDHGEAVWFYSLDQDPDPYFNPTAVARSGMHQRIIPWVSWSERATGWAYYDGGRFFHGAQPTVRAELLREGFEDYEYFLLANGGAEPGVDATVPVDATVGSAAASLTSWTKDADALAVLRHELGRYLGGERATLPILEIQSSRPRGEYHLNFQDPAGPPAADPLVVDGKTYLKIGWAAYDAAVGYGWSGEFIDDPGIARYGYDDVAGYSEVQRSYVYDDYGRDNLFEFDLAPGRYQITVGVGRPAHGYPGDPHNLSIEGQAVIDDEVTTDAAPTIERTVTIDLGDGFLSVVAGGRSASTGAYSYTFLAYIDVVPVD